jgi:hypothetical protein
MRPIREIIAVASVSLVLGLVLAMLIAGWLQ